jgi:hypothetical protein
VYRHHTVTTPDEELADFLDGMPDAFQKLAQSPPQRDTTTDETLEQAYALAVATKVVPPRETPKDDSMPALLARSLGRRAAIRETPYNTRSDWHSKIKCIGLLLDLMRLAPALRERLTSGDLVFGINSHYQGKNLDLVLGTPLGPRKPRSLADIARDCEADLDKDTLDTLEHLHEGRVDKALLAVEAKAAMTDHGKARSRLRDELGNFGRSFKDPGTIVVALVLVNVALSYISPGQQGDDPNAPPVVNLHKPEDAGLIVALAEKLPLRDTPAEGGFDHVALAGIDFTNDGAPATPVRLGPPHLEYEAVVAKIAERLQHSAR